MIRRVNQAYSTSSGRQEEEAALDIVYFTDPLCCWSWAMKPQLAQLRSAWKGTIHWRYCMGGLLPSWSQYTDSLNCINRPAQMGPVWMHASQLSGIPMPHSIWVKNPPASSYPACIAVKCAMLQSAAAGELYLQYVQEAIMIHSLNIAEYTVLLQVADQVKGSDASFDVDRFLEDMRNGHGLEAFRRDLQEVKYCSIQRFPALLIRRASRQPILITGYKTAEQLIQIIEKH